MQWGKDNRYSWGKIRIENRKTNEQLNKQTNMEAKRDNEEKIQLIGWCWTKELVKSTPGPFHPMLSGNFQ